MGQRHESESRETPTPGAKARKKPSAQSSLAYSSTQRGLEMRDTVQCPYCVSGLEFRPMVAHVDGRYICDKCGHTAYPGNTTYKCRCPKCSELELALIAS